MTSTILSVLEKIGIYDDSIVTDYIVEIVLIKLQRPWVLSVREACKILVKRKKLRSIAQVTSSIYFYVSQLQNKMTVNELIVYTLKEVCRK